MTHPDRPHLAPAPVAPENAETNDPRKRRIERAREFMQVHGVDTLIVSSPANVRYLSGFSGLEPEDREAYTVVTPHNAYLIASPLYPDQLHSAQQVLTVTPFGQGKTNLQQLTEAVKRITGEEGIQTIGIEGDHMVVDEYTQLQGLGLETKSLPVSELRVVKDGAEVEAIRKACEAGDTVFQHILPLIQEGMTETQLRNLMVEQMRQLGYDQEAFATIVAFGENAANPHYTPTDTPLARNQFVLLDFGLKGVDGYPSDMTRTVFFGKEEDMTPEQKHMYTTVQKANELVTQTLQEIPMEEFADGRVTGYDMDQTARDFIYARGYLAENFPHSLGHGLGLQVHENPKLSMKEVHTLGIGMVFTNEPGVYQEGIGGVRIEDVLAITDSGVEVLTHSPRQLICIDPDVSARRTT